MLQISTVEEKTFELLSSLMLEPLLDSTILVGGTSLALQLGHRKSTDLDLFTTESIDIESVVASLNTNFNYHPQLITDSTTIGYISDIKIDVIRHPYEWIDSPVQQNGIRLASLKDIAAMKLHAIANSGQRPKDFVDMAYLSQFFSYNQIKNFALKKYPIYDPIMFDRAIIYFGDVNMEAIDKIKMINSKMNWSGIKKRIINMTDNPDKIYPTPPLKNSQQK